MQSDPYSLDLHSESMSVSERIQTVDLWSEHRLSMVRANLEWALRRGATCHVPVSIGYRLHPQKYVGNWKSRERETGRERERETGTGTGNENLREAAGAEMTRSSRLLSS